MLQNELEDFHFFLDLIDRGINDNICFVKLSTSFKGFQELLSLKIIQNI